MTEHLIQTAVKQSERGDEDRVAVLELSKIQRHRKTPHLTQKPDVLFDDGQRCFIGHQVKKGSKEANHTDVIATTWVKPHQGVGCQVELV